MMRHGLFLILFSLLTAMPVLAKGHRHHHAHGLSSDASNGQFSCDDEREYCREMRSCAEAKYHLQQCGQESLDRDGDGIPCEKICGHH